MNKLIFVFFILIWQVSFSQDTPPPPEIPPSSAKQYPAVRPRPPNDPNKESSSFIGDPENLDPLRARQDNLKDDNEPVLEDIRSVIDAPPKVAESTVEKAAAAKKPSVKKALAKKKSAVKKKVAKAIIKKIKKNKKSNELVFRQTDDPDSEIEKRFHQNYLRYNETPTSIEDWSKATFGRSAEVYIVQKGDTLWTISETLFGDSLFWPKIWAINRRGILNPHFILPGMRVNFFPGSVEEIPTLAVGEFDKEPVMDSMAATEPGTAAESDDEVDDDEVVTGRDVLTTPGAEFDPEGDFAEVIIDLDDPTPEIPRPKKAKGASVTRLSKRSKPTSLPPSFPVYRSALYYGKVRRVDIIDLEEPVKEPLVYSTDIIMTDRLVLSDIKITFSANAELRCNAGEMIENYEFIRQSPVTEYSILQPLDPVKPEKNVVLYPYQIVGKIELYEEKKLKIKECNSYLNRDQLFVPTALVNSLKTKKASHESARIIGGPAVYEQSNYAQAQTVYVNMGNINFDQGQSFGIKSNKLDMVIGKIRILDRFGGFAVAIITEAGEAVRAGDNIVSQ